MNRLNPCAALHVPRKGVDKVDRNDEEQQQEQQKYKRISMLMKGYDFG